MKKLLENKNTLLYNIIFCIFAAFPLVTADVFLRYIVNFIYISEPIYYIVPVLFSICWITLMIFICWVIMPKKIGRILYIIITLSFGIYFAANYIYYNIFSQYLWINNIFLVSEVTDYIGYILSNINIKFILIAILYISSIIITCILWTENKLSKKKMLILLITCTILISLEKLMDYNTKKDLEEGAWEFWQRPTLIYDAFTDANQSLNIAGFYQYTFKSIVKGIAGLKEDTEAIHKEIDKYFEEKEDFKQNEMTGIFKDKNVIVVMMESMDDWLITEEYTPTIKYMMDNGINFTNFYMPTVGTGYTFNAEFAFNTGYYCPSTISSASILTKNIFPNGIGNVFKDNGYTSKSFHFNTREFYNREPMHKRFGYEEYVCFMDYIETEKAVLDSETVTSDEIYNKMIENEKFYDFIITYTAHLPYTVEDKKLIQAREKYPELNDESIVEEFRNANILTHDTDEFFRILLERLENDGLLENTVIIAFTDHFAYAIEDKEKLAELTKQAGSDIYEKVPFFIYSKDIEPMQIDKVASTIDLLPTINNLLGFENSKYYIGRDIFDNEYKGLVYFPNGYWYDGEIYYKGYDENYTEEQKQYIYNTNIYINKIKQKNDKIITTDYFAEKE